MRRAKNEETRVDNRRVSVFIVSPTIGPPRIRKSVRVAMIAFALLAPTWSLAHAQGHLPDGIATESTPVVDATLPDAPSSEKETASNSFGKSLGTAIKTIGKDELHIIKAPFSVSALKWDALVVGSTAVLIANDESVAHQVSPSWHTTSINISDAGVYGLGATAGGIFVTGLITHNDHAVDTGIRSAEASVDSVILYAALKAVLARQRPYNGPGEGKFFSGNWTSGSFPSGHATLAWTLASVMAHEYPNWPMRLLMYGAATAVSTTRVTGGVHFPADVFSGSVIGYGIGTYVAHKDRQDLMVPHSQNKIKRMQNAILEHVAIGAQ
jgi:membrane-associated phospholipid phosphatase